ncbi:hypothetical protein ACFV0T_22510 [Streptomyces sp. NPDC059582]|uniref:hypothetical protein n=1 Tax=Streptomyces sp. NPDC059582 TaxID=3346875 RepID=UPI003677C8DD
MTAEGAAADGEALAGGMANAGAVFRRGAMVQRPAPRNAYALHAYLRALKKHGFDAAPTPAGLTADGHERLTFIPGDVALPPFPPWALSETALKSVGSLIEQATKTCRAFVAARVADGDPVYLQTLTELGEWQRWDRMQAWLAAHHDTFTAALLN